MNQDMQMQDPEKKLDIFRKIYAPLTDEQKNNVERLKDKAQEYFDLLSEMQQFAYTDLRMLSLAKTNLEQASMWAVKGVTPPSTI